MQISWVHRGAVPLAIATSSLLVISGFMVSASTGLPVPEWAHVGQMVHRGAAGVVALFAVLLAVIAWRSPLSKWVKRLALGAAGIVIVQAALGMALAGSGRMAAVGLAQAMLMHALFASAAVLFLVTRRPDDVTPATVKDETSPSLRSIAWWPVFLVVIQMALGSAYRHGMVGVMPHLLGAFVIAGAVAFLGILVITTYPQHRALKRVAVVTVWLMAGQIVLGLIALLYRAQAAGTVLEEGLSPVWVVFTVGHILLGSITFGATVWMALQIREFVLPGEKIAAGVHRKASRRDELGVKLS